MAEGGRIVYYLDVDDSQFTDGLKSAADKAKASGSAVGDNFGKGLADSLSKTKGQLDSFASGLGSLLKGIGIMGASVGALGGIFTNSAGGIQQTSQAFKSIIGNVDLANKAFGQLLTYANQTPFQFNEISKAGQTLLGFGISAKQLPGVISEIGDVAGVTGGDFQGLALAAGQIFAQGRVRAQEFYQVINSGAGALGPLIAKNLGEDGVGALQKDFQTGSVSANAFFAALQQAVSKGGFAFKGAETLSQTFNGRLSTLKDTIFEVGRELLGVKVDPELGLTVQSGGLFDQMTNLLPKIGDALLVIGPYLQRGFSFLVNNSGTILSVIAGIAAGFVVARTAAIAFGIASAIAEAPLLAVLIAIAAAIGFMLVKFGLLPSIMKGVSDITKPLSSGLDKLGDLFGNDLPPKINATNQAAQDLKDKLSDIDDKIKQSNFNFREQLAEMIKASQDKVVSLKNDLEQENKDYNSSLAARKKSFEQETADEQKSLDKKVADLQKSYDKEVAAAAKSNDQRLAQFNKSLADEESKYADASDNRLAILEKQYNDELAKGNLADKAKLIQLSSQINKERLNTKAAIDDRIAALKNGYEQDRQEAEATLQQKLTDTQASIAQEKADSAEAQARKQEQYNEDILAAKTAHDQKVADTQKQLSAELDLQSKHKDEVLSVKDHQFRDEIQKLEDNHKLELDAFQKQKDALTKNATEQTTAVNNELLKTGNIDTASIGTNIGTSIISSFKKAFNDEKAGFLANFKDGLIGVLEFIKTGDIQGDTKGLGFNVSGKLTFKDAFKALFGGFLAGGGRAEKGVPYVVGEKRPELFVPDQNGRIIPDLTALQGSTGKVENNYYTTVNPNFDGIVARSRSEWRDIVKDGLEAVNEDLRARGMKELIIN